MKNAKDVASEYTNKLLIAKVIDESQMTLINDAVEYGYDEALKQICTINANNVYFIRDSICQKYDKK